MSNLIVSCVSVAVAFIPEGLPIAVTASLTITASIMKKNNVLCKSLKTVETLGKLKRSLESGVTIQMEKSPDFCVNQDRSTSSARTRLALSHATK